MNNLLKTANDIGPLLNKYIDEENSNRRLSQPVITALKEAGFWRLTLPQSLGGIEADPLTIAQVTEQVAKHNTAAGWSMMVANTANWWSNHLSEKGIEEVYQFGRDTLIAGAFHPPMKATPTKDGFIINGRSPLASNINESQWTFVSAMVWENDQPKFIDGRPVMIATLMKTSDCSIIDTWQTIGMRATDSNDVCADAIFVPNHRAYFLMPEYERNNYFKGDLYRFATIGINVTSLIAPIALAIASNAINELKLLADKKTPMGSMVSIKERGVIQRKLGMAEALVGSARAYLHQTILQCWTKTIAGESLTPHEKAGLLLAGTHTNQSCLQAIDLMYSAAGSSAIYTANKLARYFCDAQVIRQHGFANESRYETAAQVFLGLQPDLPVVNF